VVTHQVGRRVRPGIEAIGKSPTRRQHHVSAAERTKSSRPQVRYARITRPESGWRKREKLLYRTWADFLALARACCQLSSSLVSHRRAKDLRAARNYRMQARIDGRTIRLMRKKLDWTERFLSFADALKALGLGSAWIDGEILVEDASGLSSFNDLQADLKAGRPDRFRYFVFDVLYCEGFDLTNVVLKDRKNLLRQLLAILSPGSPIRLSEHLDVDGPTMLVPIRTRRDRPQTRGLAVSIRPRRSLDQEQVPRATRVYYPGLHSFDGGLDRRRWPTKDAASLGLPPKEALLSESQWSRGWGEIGEGVDQTRREVRMRFDCDSANK
jgi:hypothetical protein